MSTTIVNNDDDNTSANRRRRDTVHLIKAGDGCVLDQLLKTSKTTNKENTTTTNRRRKWNDQAPLREIGVATRSQTRIRANSNVTTAPDRAQQLKEWKAKKAAAKPTKSQRKRRQSAQQPIRKKAALSSNGKSTRRYTLQSQAKHRRESNESNKNVKKAKVEIVPSLEDSDDLVQYIERVNGVEVSSSNFTHHVTVSRVRKSKKLEEQSEKRVKDNTNVSNEISSFLAGNNKSMSKITTRKRTSSLMLKKQYEELQARLVDMEAMMNEKQCSYDGIKHDYEELQAKLQLIEKECMDLRVRETMYKDRFQTLERAVEDGEKLVKEAELRHTNMLQENEMKVGVLNASLEQAKEHIASLECRVKDVQMKYDDDMKMKEQEIQIKTNELTQAINQINELKKLRETDLQMRKTMHNTIQNLKGNIRVYCRLRPSKTNDDDDNDDINYSVINATAMQYHDGDVLTATTRRMNVTGQTKRDIQHHFKFDRVFDSHCKQDDVYKELEPLITTCMDGYNVSVFAYGQTGSGKTHTMFGPPDIRNGYESNERGLIPRAVNQIFQEICIQSQTQWTFKLQASMVEIYQEEVYDLLSKRNKMKISTTRQGAINVPNLKRVEIHTTNDINNIFETAINARSTATTAMNEYSSRSHTVFQLYIHGEQANSERKVSSVLSLIDLAGSERLKKSLATGEQRKEAQNINSSLMNLSKCITALSEKKTHIPYRDSKLTYLLQNSLGGQSKTAFFVNIASDTMHKSESIATLNFAKKLKTVTLLR